MSEEKLEILRRDVTIPQIVQERADKAYAMIAKGGVMDDADKAKEKGNCSLHNTKKRRKQVILAAAAVMLFAGLTVSAGTKWSAVMSKKWQVEELQKEKLQEEGAVSYAMQSQTQNGITITAEQSIADHYSVYLAFRVEGFPLEEGMTPAFEMMQVNVDGVDGMNYSTGFLDGSVTGEEGGMSFWISMTESERGWALGKDIYVELTDLCSYEDSTGEAVPDSMVYGTWKFEWNLQGTDHMREWTGRLPLGDSGAVICRVELSPISGYVEYDWPRQRETRQAVGVDGESVEISRWARAPRMSGVKLEDGTEYRDLFSGDGTEGYLSSDQTSTLYYACRGNERIIDPDRVAGLFFENAADGGFYEVPFE